MKVKLLKKIRKRFEIVRIDELASNDLDYLKTFEIENGLPFYMVEDLEYEPYHIKRWIFKKYSEAFEFLQKKVLKEYSEQFRHKDGKQTKVWWVK